jgi:CheY-like chemotaxis protein
MSGRPFSWLALFLPQALKQFSTLPIYMAAREINVKILLVEDSKTIRRENESALQNAGYEVICAEDGESALQMAQEQQPDLVLLDMILPRMSGQEVLKRLKRGPSTAEIPVVVLSSLSEKNRQKLLDEGAEEYLEKNTLMPIRGVNLLPNKLENVICRINRRRGIAFSSVPLHD